MTMRIPRTASTGGLMAVLTLLAMFLAPLSVMAQEQSAMSSATAESFLDADGFTVTRFPKLPDPEGFAGMFAGTSHGVLIAAGGANFPEAPPWEGGTKVWTDAIYVLDASKDNDLQWKKLDQRLPRPLGYGVSVSYLDQVICIGGSDAERHYPDVFAMRWNAKEGKIEFEELPPLPQPCAMAAGTIVGTTIYVAGGLTEPNATRAMHTFWALDMSAPAAQRQWRELEPWPGPGRHLAVAGGLEGAFYLFSGIELEADEAGKPRRLTPYLTDAYRYTPGRRGEAGKWERLPDLPHGVAAAPSPALPISRTSLLIPGGDRQLLPIPLQDHPGFTRDAQIYDIRKDAWITVKDALPEGSSRVTAPTVYWNESFAIVSGERVPGRRSPEVFRIVPVQPGFGTLNWIVLGGYLAGMLVIGFWASTRNETTDDFFLAGRRIPWWAAGLSIYGTQLSAITFMAIPAVAYGSDWVRIIGNWMIAAVAPIVIYFYLPFFRRLNITTAYEYLEKRFDVLVRLVGSLTFIVFQFARMGIVIYLPALALSAVTGVDVFVCILLMGIMCTIYTVLGGIEAVIWTDVVQVLVLLGGALLCIVMVAVDVGGFGEVVRIGMAHDKFRIFNWGTSPAEMTVWVMVVGMLFLNLTPYTTDQAVIQRYLTTRDEKASARSIWTNGLMCIPTGIIFFLLGTALFVFYQTRAEVVTPDKIDKIVPWFVVHELPAGVAGLVIAGVFAAAMSTLDSSMNSIATALVTDFYRRFQPQATDRQALTLAKVITLVVGVIGTGSAMAMAMSNIYSIFDHFQMLLGYIGGGLCGIFILGVFTRGASTSGALIGALVTPLVVYFVERQQVVHDYLLAAVGTITCVVVGYAVSMIWPDANRNLSGLTIHSLFERRTPTKAGA